MTDAPDTFTMTPEQATAKIEELEAAYRGVPPSITPTDAQQAQARINYLAADKDFVDRLDKGDAAAKAELKALVEQVAGGNEPYTFENEVVDAVSDPNRMPKERYDGLLAALVEQGAPESSVQYIRDLDSGARTDLPTAGDGKACKRAIDRLTRDPEWGRKVLAGDMVSNAIRTRLSATIALAADDGKPITPQVAQWLLGL